MAFHARVTHRTTITAYVLLAAICLAAPVSAQSQRAASPPGMALPIEDSLNVWEKRLVQEGLILLGYYNGFADGAFGKGTHDAIASYQAKHGRSATGQATAADALDLGGAALALRKKLDWRPLDTSTGISMSYPAAILTKRKNEPAGAETLDSGDGHVSLLTIHITAAADGLINTLFDKQVNDPVNKVTYTYRRPNKFILSGDRQGGKFYTRLEQQGDDIRGYDLVWGANEDTVMQNVSVLISNGFHPFGDTNAQGEPTYPTLQRLAQQAGPATSDQASNAPPAQNQTGRGSNDGSDRPEGLTEQKACNACSKGWLASDERWKGPSLHL